MGPCKSQLLPDEDPHNQVNPDMPQQLKVNHLPSSNGLYFYSYDHSSAHSRGVPPAWCNLRIDLSMRSLCLWLIENLSSSALRGPSVLSPLKATSSPNELWASLAPSLLLDSPSTTLVKYPVLGRGGANPLAFLQSVQWSNVYHVYCDHDHMSSVHPLSRELRMGRDLFGISQSSSS